MDLAYLPSPSTGVLHLGPVPLRAYAFCIILGVFVAIWLGNRRWVARGGEQGVIADVTIWAVPFGLAGGRLYHVVTSPDAYFGEHGEPIRALYVWEGGLGIWGAIALGGVGAWIGCRRHRIPLPAFADAVAPGIVLAQAIGRWGNWFNQELYGRPTTLPWGLEIDRAHRPSGMLDIATYHPTFLYESLWNIGVAALVLWAASRFPLGHGRTFALYVAAYTVGRFWTEYLRIDESHTFLGLRLNNWTSVLVFLGAVACLLVPARRHPGIEDVAPPQDGGANERADEPRLVDASAGLASGKSPTRGAAAPGTSGTDHDVSGP
ncbi:prolipoprotein diacylglyceryl transferase [Streptomyces sp. NBC_00825]|uniref:prolipoprotein diacylglyceryl transferase n=1 Tax=unclassified Streptomyces TaxID=2593676 RepID=UPI002256357C|nr:MULTISPECIES: prolipoprotein diacylglyceryl transferase [unclassified Streptomyces]WTB59232.1 prolipoprotein diacylglyceryl transferase [Streptomyces sp. NBC_00826]WTH87896.1 prolipoprotein diacylglyceryl transferase [Streptomyces sp. NBC_00825]WTH96623.1 prolipoprotein diacylglyceryl transferase [Streptomyces sp. NBC_00822]MCX4870099.1 prolipoprotein diacylglyceryl transferase [Streptomyces sp. NBC_00906]MCX4901262.1 prolipoprotein diacylglyceryl transferase [Streptomyces sp. NBC_00892]